MGTGKILALICASLIFAPLAAAQSVPADVPRSPPVPLLSGLRFNTVALRSTSADDSPSDGFGLIIAGNGNNVLIATAAHVVIAADATPAKLIRVTFVVDESGRVETFEGHVAGVPAPGIAENLDLAFVSVKLNRPQPLAMQSTAAAKIEPGDLVRILGSVQDRDWSTTPGEVMPTPGDPETITFTGGAAAGASGSPLVAYAGVVGLVRESGSSGYATPMSAVRAQFDRYFAGSWQWLAHPLPIVRRVGWVRLHRVDALGDRLPAKIVLTNADGAFYLTPDQWMAAPTGRYSVKPWTLSGIRSDVACDLTVFDVAAWSQRDLPLVCRADPTGTWDLMDGRLIRIGPAASTRYPVTVLRQDGRVIGNGSGQIFNDLTLRLELQDEDVGVSTLDVALAQGNARGTLSLIQHNIERPIQIFRRGQ